MDKIEFKEIVEGLRNGIYTPSDIINWLKEGSLDYLYSDEIEEIIFSFSNDEDKLSVLKYVYPPIKLIKTFSNEESVVKALEQIKDDNEKIRITLTCLKSEDYILEAIEKIDNTDKAFPLKLLLSRDKLKEIYCREEDEENGRIGLDKNITFGVEIESLGPYSTKMFEIAENNGTVIHPNKKQDCNKMIKRRKW